MGAVRAGVSPRSHLEDISNRLYELVIVMKRIDDRLRLNNEYHEVHLVEKANELAQWRIRADSVRRSAETDAT